MNEGLSTTTTSDDFPVTRRVIGRLDAWLAALASPLLPLQQIPAGPDGATHSRAAFFGPRARIALRSRSMI